MDEFYVRTIYYCMVIFFFNLNNTVFSLKNNISSFFHGIFYYGTVPGTVLRSTGIKKIMKETSSNLSNYFFKKSEVTPYVRTCNTLLWNYYTFFF